MKSGGSQKAVALIKFFSEESHYLAFKNGSSMFRTPHYYRMLEYAGRGDRSESCLGYWDSKLGDQMPIIKIDGGTINTNDAETILVYSAHEKNDAWLQSWCVVGPHNGFEESLEQMLDEFGAYFVVLPAKNINAYAELLAKTSDFQVRFGFIRYSDNPLDRSLTVKDSKFSYQKEFRFYIGECAKDEVQDKTIELGGMGSLFLEAASLCLQSPCGKTKYCTLGRKNIVVTD